MPACGFSLHPQHRVAQPGIPRIGGLGVGVTQSQGRLSGSRRVGTRRSNGCRLGAAVCGASNISIRRALQRYSSPETVCRSISWGVLVEDTRNPRLVVLGVGLASPRPLAHDADGGDDCRYQTPTASTQAARVSLQKDDMRGG
jgi:hypothetical protein